MKTKVQEWIANNFTGQITQKDWPALPGGIVLQDEAGGEMFCWWNFLEEKVEFKIAD